MRFTSLGLVLATGFALTSVGCGSSDDDGGDGTGTTVTIAGVGTVNGSATDSMRSFKGIPYAAPPVGELRWKAPQKAAPLAEALDATRFGSGCLQAASPFGLQSASEDCLFLNVYAPKDAGPHPVMFWIHGGAFLSGESSGYDPTALVAQGVVVVTINYRLGMLGFLAHPSLEAEAGTGAPSTNFGLLDQQFALQWVHDNIASFGGDPGNVTVFGESAGGFSVFSLLAMPSTHGLFHHAIVESGAYGVTLQPTLDSAKTQGASFATAAHCTEPCSADSLRALSAADVLTAQTSLKLQTLLPSIDGTVVPTGGVSAALTSGSFEKVPLIMGSNHDEWALFIGLYLQQTGASLETQADYEAAAIGTFGTPAATALLANYPLSSYGNDPAPALTAAGTDFVFACPSLVAAGQTAAKVATFAYEFSDTNAPQGLLPVPKTKPNFHYGAAHASELQYLWDLPATQGVATPLTADQKALKGTMVKYWTQFAKTGDPNAAGSPQWPAFTTASQTMLTLNTPAAAVAPTTGFKAEHKCN